MMQARAGTAWPGTVALASLLAIGAAACEVASAVQDRPGSAGARAAAQPPATASALDARVRAFLDQRRGAWHDLNVPEADGRTMHDLIVSRRLTRALEIGTSTGHSGIWIAWALSKTGGRLTTIEIDPGRHQQALANFKAAGLEAYVDARLGDAHELTRTLAGPWDFVFSDADKEWYPNYLSAVWPKVAAGGCFTAHNVSMRGGAIGEFLDALERLPDGQTRIDRSSSAGLSITCKIESR